MAKDLFSIPIFFIVFRETVEAAIIISVLLGLTDQIINKKVDHPRVTTTTTTTTTAEGGAAAASASRNSDSKEESVNEIDSDPVDDEARRKRLLKKMKLQIYLGVVAGFILALAIGTIFIVVWFKKASNLWTKSEELYEAIFQLIAAVMIFAMGISMLRLDRAKTRWRIKLERAFDGKSTDRSTKTGKWFLFVLPFVTVLREGLEGVIFVSGVSLGQPGSSVPIPTIIGLICGVIVGVLIYQFASRTTVTTFLIIMTNFLLLIGSGLFSKSIAAFERHNFNTLLGADIDDAAGGSGPGTYDVRGNVWHLNCCNPESDGQGWGVFWSVFGWSNNASVGTVLGYVFYWLAVVVALIIMKYKEGRTKLFRFESAAGRRRREYREQQARIHEKDSTAVITATSGIEEKGRRE